LPTQDRIFYTNSFANITIKYNGLIPIDVIDYVKCSIGDSNAYYNQTTYKIVNNQYWFNCFIRLPNNFGGLKNLSLVYQETFSFSNQYFQLSENTLEIVFITTSTITNLYPTSLSTNFTNILTLTTNLLVLDYGNADYKCKCKFLNKISRIDRLSIFKYIIGNKDRKSIQMYNYTIISIKILYIIIYQCFWKRIDFYKFGFF
jgi:hypothetical protein